MSFLKIIAFSMNMPTSLSCLNYYKETVTKMVYRINCVQAVNKFLFHVLIKLFEYHETWDVFNNQQFLSIQWTATENLKNHFVWKGEKEHENEINNFFIGMFCMQNECWSVSFETIEGLPTHYALTSSHLAVESVLRFPGRFHFMR